jgi:polyhydroxyalkanoate synthesis regulator phasin
MQYRVEEIKGFEAQLELLVRKLNFMKEEQARTVDANAKFAVKEEITQLEAQISDLKTKLGQATGLATSSSEGNISQAVRQLHIDEDEEIELLHLVNCDRREVMDKFWDAFDQKEQEHFQYYFISGCPTQMPPSFAERLVYEVLKEELNNHTDSIHYIAHEETGRLRIQDLPLGRNTRKSQQRFKEYVQERFRFADTQSFDAFIETGVPNLPYDYVSVVFEIHERKWSDFIPEYLQWMMETFRSPHERVPTFLFFFVIYIDGQHLGKLSTGQQQILDAIQQITEGRQASLLTPLQPVEDGDLRAWLMDLGERNPNQVQAVIDALVASLRDEDQRLFEKEQRFNMKDIEELQALVYQIANE